MAFVPLGGKSRRYLNTETGETISRRQYFKLMSGLSFEEKAKRNREKDLAVALARPARGRTKATTQEEIELRLQVAQEAAEMKRRAKLEKKARQKSRTIKRKKIRPQLLKAGHRAARIAFSDWSEFKDIRREMLEQKAPNGKRLITSYGLGVAGIDERTGNEIHATLVTLQSPKVDISEDEAIEMLDIFMESRPYFIFLHWWVHLHFDIDYAEQKAKKARAKNIPEKYRKR